MKRSYYPLSYFCVLGLIFLCSCTNPVAPLPEYKFTYIHVSYATDQGVDLLNPSTPNHYKEEDISVVNKIDKNGTIKEIPQGYIGVYLYGIKSKYSFAVKIPLKIDGVTPIETYVRLSPVDTDTITYLFSNTSTSPERPTKIFYNKKATWLLDDPTTADEWWKWEVITK